jgi:hypothetical protein
VNVSWDLPKTCLLEELTYLYARLNSSIDKFLLRIRSGTSPEEDYQGVLSLQCLDETGMAAIVRFTHGVKTSAEGSVAVLVSDGRDLVFACFEQGFGDMPAASASGADDGDVLEVVFEACGLGIGVGCRHGEGSGFEMVNYNAWVSLDDHLSNIYPFSARTRPWSLAGAVLRLQRNIRA